MLVGIIGIVRKHSERDEGCGAGSAAQKTVKRMSIQLLMKELFFQAFKLFLMLTCYDFIIFIGILQVYESIIKGQDMQNNGISM